MGDANALLESISSVTKMHDEIRLPAGRRRSVASIIAWRSPSSISKAEFACLFGETEPCMS
jgi:hypothetical protein